MKLLLKDFTKVPSSMIPFWICWLLLAISRRLMTGDFLKVK